MPDRKLAAVAVDLQLAPASRRRGAGRPGRARRAGPVAGASGSAPSSRSIPSSRRISVSAPRPVRSIVSSTSRVDAFASSSVRRSAPACTTITETWWAITSCSSRAIRARSSTTASRAATSRSRSASWARRSRSPITRRTSSMAASDDHRERHAVLEPPGRSPGCEARGHGDDDGHARRCVGWSRPSARTSRSPRRSSRESPRRHPRSQTGRSPRRRAKKPAAAGNRRRYATCGVHGQRGHGHHARLVRRRVPSQICSSPSSASRALPARDRRPPDPDAGVRATASAYPWSTHRRRFASGCHRPIGRSRRDRKIGRSADPKIGRRADDGGTVPHLA